MLKFTLGLTSGLALGGAGAMILGIVTIIALEDSPELIEYLKQRTSS